MASHHRPQLSRLNINGPPSLNMQQPGMAFDPRAQSMFSPALPTSIQQGFHPPYPISGQSALQTPMQPMFPQQPPGAPGRPAFATHRSGPSVAQLAAAGIHPPNGMPMTPLGQGFPGQMPPGMQQGMSFGGGGPNFVHRNRRAPSVSLGGPPKAILGGPNRKVSPLPPAAEAAPPPAVVRKKLVVKFPKETVEEEGEDKTITRAPWARNPMPLDALPRQKVLQPPELISADVFPPEAERGTIGDTIEVYLPGKLEWKVIKKREIEEKLQKLGVEPGAGNGVPQIHAPHGRATSISSPADSALLYWKLNQLQKSQNGSSSNSLATSPQPPFNMTPSPSNQLPPRMQANRHGHSMSLAQPPTHQFTPPPPTFNPFGPNATLGDSPGPTIANLEPNIHAPQGRVPVTASSLALPPSLSRPESRDSRPDFARGFGLDVPEESEEEMEEFVVPAPEASEEVNGVAENEQADDEGYTEEVVEDQDGATTVAHSRLHSRHVSNALSLGSVGGVEDGLASDGRDFIRSSTPNGQVEFDDMDQDAIGEWTGSEDQNLSDLSEDEESIGEWSNPSDEERARQDRVQRRNARRTKREIDAARNLPKFPQPPANTMMFGHAAPDDDMISNPSEEENLRTQRHGGYLGVESGEYGTRPSSSSSSVRSRPLPQPPHSRGPSGQLSVSGYDPALAHSRGPSNPFGHGGTQAQSQSSINAPSLNPNAKPFVFGAPSSQLPLPSWASNVAKAASPPPPAPQRPTFSFGHSRVPSFGKPLNATAQEFKPGGFTFKPPPAAPHKSFEPPSENRPLPAPPVGQSPARAVQGREKRQRRVESVDEDEDDDGKSNMSSFRFPSAPGDSPSSVRRSAPSSPKVFGARRQSSLNADAQPFTFSGFSSKLPFIPKDPPISLPFALIPAEFGSENDASLQASTPKNEHSELPTRELPIPPSSRARRAPIPLDFKQHSNTVPAGLFKAHANGDERTRRTVRSRLGSREIFDHVHRPSLDDLAVPSISRKISRAQLITEPQSPEGGELVDDVFTPAVQRRSSLPDGTQHSFLSSPISGLSIPTGNLTKRFETQHLEQSLGDILDDKFGKLRNELLHVRGNPSMDARVHEMLSLIKAQVEKDGPRSFHDGYSDARGELDFEAIQDAIQTGHAESRAQTQRELGAMIQRLEQYARLSNPSELLQNIERSNAQTLNAVVATLNQMAAHNHNNRGLPDDERESLIRELVSVISPMVAHRRQDSVDYEALTFRLSQAVKPHISQLIDLASDKRETAALIVDAIIPRLPAPHTAPVLETEAIAAQLTSEIRRVIAPVDAHEIKEQVADLVVERLDSRLAVRDKAFNVDSLSGKVVEGITRSLEPMRQVASIVDTLVGGQKALSSRSDELVTTQNELLAILSEMPAKISVIPQAIDAVKGELLEQAKNNHSDASSTSAFSQIQSIIDTVAGEQKGLSAQTNEVLALQHDVIGRLNTLPDALIAATSVLQNAHAEFASSRDASRNDLEEIKRLKTQNSDIQVQLAKARGAHGQVRVEKDNLAEKVGVMEKERDHYRTQAEELQASASGQASIQARNAELEEALSKALERLRASDVTAQASEGRIIELEKAARSRDTEAQTLKSKVDTLERDAGFAKRDNEAAIQAQKILQTEHDRLISQQTHWEELHRASEQIATLTSLISKADSEEISELKRIRDRSHKLEGEHAALQKRFKDFENKVTNSEKAANTARQSLAQAQQRASEWEKRAKEYEGDLEMTRTKLDQAEQTHAQLDADYSLAKLQLEEKDADDRLSKDRENNLRNQVSTLENLVKRLEVDVSKAKATAAPVARSTYANGHTQSPPRPDSRASTAYGVSRSGTPVARVNGSSVRSNTPPQTSVWDSMHAPRPTHASGPRYPHLGPSTPKTRQSSYHRQQTASPALSTVSLTPTQGDDGWWS